MNTTATRKMGMYFRDYIATLQLHRKDVKEQLGLFLCHFNAMCDEMGFDPKRIQSLAKDYYHPLKGKAHISDDESDIVTMDIKEPVIATYRAFEISYEVYVDDTIQRIRSDYPYTKPRDMTLRKYDQDTSITLESVRSVTEHDDTSRLMTYQNFDSLIKKGLHPMPILGSQSSLEYRRDAIQGISYVEEETLINRAHTLPDFKNGRHPNDKRLGLGLMLAAERGNIALVDTYRKKGVPWKVGKDHALVYAMRNKHFKLASSIINDGESIDIQDHRLIREAVELNNIEAVRFLIDNGIDVTIKNNMPLTRAARYRNREIILLLIAHGATLENASSSTLKNIFTNVEVYLDSLTPSMSEAFLEGVIISYAKKAKVDPTQEIKTAPDFLKPHWLKAMFS